uniref:RING-CH-type domain-containing protein n=1 Tax=Meloidogyne hapla TaxID=6305 RepID=A0A1I8BTZ1_MELHA
MESANFPSTSAASSSNNSAEQDPPQSSTPTSPITTPLQPETPSNALTPFTDPLSSRQCRICLLTTETKRKPLISPCHCSGTVRHVHIHCLAHWIEVSSRKAACINSTRYTKPLPPHCELCGFRYRRRPFVDDVRDRVLNALCLLLILIMGICGWVAGQHVQSANNRRMVTVVSNRNRVATISQPDITILVSVLLLFTAFFLAIFTQYRAEVTLFRALSSLWATNRNWRIRDLPHPIIENEEKQIFIKRKDERFMENAQTQTFLTSRMLLMPGKI